MKKAWVLVDNFENYALLDEYLLSQVSTAIRTRTNTKIKCSLCQDNDNKHRMDSKLAYCDSKSCNTKCSFQYKVLACHQTLIVALYSINEHEDPTPPTDAVFRGVHTQVKEVIVDLIPEKNIFYPR